MTARPLLALALAIGAVAAPLAAGAAAPAIDELQNVHFGSSSASLTAKGYGQLRAVAAAMQADAQLKLEIAGHADASGDARSNLTLSVARARAAHDFIVSLGIDPLRMRVEGYGDSQPLNDNSTLELRAFNRRVQFRRLD
jgi:OOP family OmpA-OmpF porin